MKLFRNENRKPFIRSLYHFLLLNIPVTLLISLRYLLNAPDAENGWASLHAVTALFGNTLFLYLVLFILLLIPLALFPARRTFMLTAVPLVLLFHLVLFVDAAIFAIYRFHFNGMVLNLLMNTASWDSVRFGVLTVATFVAVIFLLVYLMIRLARIVLPDAPQKSGKKTHTLRKIILLVLIISFVTERAVFAVSDMYNYTPVTRQITLYPLYMPVLVKGFAIKQLGFQPPHDEGVKIRMGSALKYPATPLAEPTAGNRPNIVLIVIDSMRADMLTPETSPNIHRFASENSNFTNHVSGGNASRFGVFTLLYGLYGSYWHPVLGERKGSVLMDALAKSGYDMKILSSTSLHFPEFRETAFSRVTQHIEDNFPGEGPVTRDPAQADRFVQWLEERNKQKPFFAFMFFDAPHERNFPKEFDKFTPNTRTNYLKVSEKSREMYLNSHKNAVLFDDAMTAKVLDALKQKGLMENSIVIITADHGDEFFESGYFGHTSAFTVQQTRVPMVIHFPNGKAQQFTSLTSHHDIVPTLMPYIGFNSDPKSYSLGMPITSSPADRQVVSCGWDECAIIDNRSTLVFSTEIYNAGIFDLKDTKTYKPLNDAAEKQKKLTALQEVAKEMSLFLK